MKKTNLEHYGDFIEEIIKMVPENRILVLDIETAPPAETRKELLEFPKKIIGLGAMYTHQREPHLFITEGRDFQQEREMLQQFNDFLHRKPFVIVGYGISSFDRPILTVKLKKEYGEEQWWDITDPLERAYCLDLINPVSFYLYNRDEIDSLSPLPFEEVITFQVFKDLPLRKKEKELAPKGKHFIEKGKKIVNLWENEKDKFKSYLRCDVWNCNEIFKQIYELGS